MAKPKRLAVNRIGTHAKELNLGDTKIHHLPHWHTLTHPQRLAVIRRIAMMRGRDPRIARLAVTILRDAGAQPRQYEKQAAALLTWVQDPKNIYYVNEPGERLQDPIHTLKVKHADCFAVDTLVLRSDGELIPIQNVVQGDEIWGKDKWSKVTATEEKGVLPITEIGLNNGSVLRLTEDHKVYVRSCAMHGPTCPDLVGQCANCKDAQRTFTWVRVHVSELREGMELLQPEQIVRPEIEQQMQPDDSWLYGAFIAEGWTQGSSRCAISGQDGNWKEATKHRVKQIGDERGWEMCWHRKYIAINNMAITLQFWECGQGALNKHIPTGVLMTCNLASLDEGLKLDASENTHGSGWTLGTISPRLAVQYRVLQRMLGRSTSIKCVTSHGGFGPNPIYRVGVRLPRADGKRIKRLRVEAIHRGVTEVPCYDISTDDRYVYLPEADCTVSNCDDLVLLLSAFYESVGLPWRLVLSGRAQDGQKLRYIEGSSVPPNVKWGHIYMMVGTPAFKPSTWFFCEPTIQGVPLGWDVVSGDASYLPEMARVKSGPAKIALPGPAPADFEPKMLPAAKNRSPAYAMAYGGYEQALIGGVTAGSVIAGNHVEENEEDQRFFKVDWDRVATAVVTGIVISISTAVFLDWVNGKGLWANKGHLVERWGWVLTPPPVGHTLLVPPED